jgi:hypothetical protein
MSPSLLRLGMLLSSHSSKNFHSHLIIPSPIQVSATVRERPDLQVKPYTVNLKATSKLSFLAREDVEKVVLMNLEYLPSSNELVVDLPSLI